MRLTRLPLLLTLSCVSLFAAERKTLYVDRMDGFERYVEDAIRQSESAVEFIEEREHPDLKVMLGKQFTSVYAEVLYEKQTGRKGGYVLRAVDPRTGQELASHTFDMSANDDGKRRAATDFAQKLKSKLNGAQKP